MILPLPNGMPDQRRPAFFSFDDARAALTAMERDWKKMLVAHKKAARKK